MHQGVEGRRVPPQDDRHCSQDQEGGQRVYEVRPDGNFRILPEHSVLEQDDLLGVGEQGDCLRAEGGQAGHHCVG